MAERGDWGHGIRTAGRAAGVAARGAEAAHAAAGRRTHRFSRCPRADGVHAAPGGRQVHRDEAAAFIAQLEETESSGEPDVPRPPDPRVSASEQVLRRMPAEQLAAELQRRGWVVVQP